MKTKTILSIAIIATLPLTAMADETVTNIGPAAVPANGTAVIATANPPYQTLTPTNDDRQHIASTAYVKGAYNDAIAAINKTNSDMNAMAIELDSAISSVQDSIPDVSGFIDSIVLDGILSDLVGEIQADVMRNVQDTYQAQLITNGSSELNREVWGSDLIDDAMGDGVMTATSADLQQLDLSLVSVGGLVTALQDVTVKVFTTWGGDTTRDVHLSSGGQSN